MSVRLLFLSAIAGACLLLGLLGWWSLQAYRLRWAIDDALQTIGNVESVEERAVALRIWEQRTAPYWRGGRADLVEALLQRRPDQIPAVRDLLGYLTEANFANRIDDWQRWARNKADLERGRNLTVVRRERVQVDPLWRVPIGRVTPNCTLMVLNAEILLITRGEQIGQADAYDGILRIDGQSRQADYFYTAPEDDATQVVGFTLVDRTLAAVTDRGTLFRLAQDGAPQGGVLPLGARPCSAPLAIDTNSDGATDVVVVTSAGNVIAMSGASGRTPWVTALPRFERDEAPGAPETQAWLASGDLLESAGREIFVTTLSGRVYVLSARDGRVLWQQDLGAPLDGPALVFDTAEDGHFAAVLGDGARFLWHFERRGDRLDAFRFTRNGLSSTAALHLAPRTLEQPDGAPPLLIIGSANADGRGSAIAAYNGTAVEWRAPLRGTLVTPPAVADLNRNPRDPRSEIVAITANLLPESDDEPRGWMYVLSPDGHYLRVVEFDAPLILGPVIADADGDARLEVLVADTAGQLHCFGTAGPGGASGLGRVEWGLPAGDPHHSNNLTDAYQWGQRIRELQWDY